MPSILILRSPFLQKVQKRDVGENTTVLGKAANDYIEQASQNPAWKQMVCDKDWEEKKSKFENELEFASDDDALFVIHEGAVGLTEDILFRFLSSQQQVLRDYEGNPAVLRISANHWNTLRQVLPTDFDTFYESWVDAVQPREEDAILDELILDVPVIDGFLHLQIAEKNIAQRICYQWMERGVRIDEPTLTRISPDTVLGEGTWIQGICRIEGKTKIGKNCLITDRSEIRDSVIGDGVHIYASVIESSEMEADSDIGPYSHLRPKASIGKGVHIGNFVEVKKARLDDETKAGHLAYIGDADVGKDVNISCGVIFCNYDGKTKHRSTVGDHAFLGSNANLVAPVHVADEGYIAAGSTVTKDVGKGELAVERAVQKNIEGYVAKRKEKGLL